MRELETITWADVRDAWQRAVRNSGLRGQFEPAVPIEQHLATDYGIDVVGDPRHLYLMITGLDDAQRALQIGLYDWVVMMECDFGEVGRLNALGDLKRITANHLIRLFTFVESGYLVGANQAQEEYRDPIYIPESLWPRLRLTDREREIVASHWSRLRYQGLGDRESPEQLYFFVVSRLILLEGLAQEATGRTARPLEVFSAKARQAALDSLPEEAAQLVAAA